MSPKESLEQQKARELLDKLKSAKDHDERFQILDDESSTEFERKIIGRVKDQLYPNEVSQAEAGPTTYQKAMQILRWFSAREASRDSKD